MEEKNLLTVKKLSICALILSFSSFNVYGIFLSLFTMYGIQNRKINVLNISFYMGFFESLVFNLLWIGFIIIMITYRFSIVILLIFIILSIQTILANLITYDLNKFRNNLDLYVIRDGIFYNSSSIDILNNMSNSEIDTLPSYSSSMETLPPYTTTDPSEENKPDNNNISIKIVKISEPDLYTETKIKNLSQKNNNDIEEQDIVTYLNN